MTTRDGTPVLVMVNGWWRSWLMAWSWRMMMVCDVSWWDISDVPGHMGCFVMGNGRWFGATSMTADIHRYHCDRKVQTTDFHVFLNMTPIGMTFCCDIRINTYILTYEKNDLMQACKCIHPYRSVSNHRCAPCICVTAQWFPRLTDGEWRLVDRLRWLGGNRINRRSYRGCGS